MGHDRQIKSLHGNELLTKIREIAKKFPEVIEAVDKFGHTSFRVKDKPFVMMGENGDNLTLSIKTLKTTQQLLLQEQDRFFKTPYIGQHGWTSVSTNQKLNWNVIEGFILEGYLQAAPRNLSKGLMEALKNE
ncbi:MmcQ/YjbR family DNA-binding protein [Bacillus sp. S3]|uniref:MmcQ/YjbR family DNA-binding protein n=1 Tax=Bacillus sp. S3 TaxID=486398 RepID=UPI001188ABC3|nr:MmcQ/YjbR family DNA-binding protein [Bacillus sp. S3]QCJ42419.1 MmcQ/YjbR family DNA-binding protein [Bacillus sp. S3]